MAARCAGARFRGSCASSWRSYSSKGARFLLFTRRLEGTQLKVGFGMGGTVVRVCEGEAVERPRNGMMRGGGAVGVWEGPA